MEIYLCPELDIESFTYEECRKTVLRELCKVAKANPKRYIQIDQYAPLRIVIKDTNAPNKRDHVVDRIGGVISNGKVEAYGSKKVWGRRYPVEWTATNMRIKENSF